MADVSTNALLAAQPGTGGIDPMAFPGVMQGGQSAKIIERRHPEWRQHQLRWRFLLDSWEGGEAYRQAIYGWDLTGLPIRNLIRHKREYPEAREQNYYGVLGRPPGSDQYAQATNDDYELRRARTPIPTFLFDTIERHLSKVYTQEVQRTAPPEVEKWWKDVDGSGSDIKDWMRDIVAPLLLCLGQLDLIFDHPAAPEGVKINTKADQEREGLDAVVASYILPENMVWWTLDARGKYVECLVCEPQEAKGPVYRYWDRAKWVLYDSHGEVEDKQFHPYGRPPIIRIFDRRRPRAKNVGMPRYEAIAEIQREYYNRDSELILSDALQAHPVVMAPEDYCQADNTIPIGPGNILPLKKDCIDGSVTYTPFQVLDFPKGAADSLRENLGQLRDQADRSALLTKPAGASGTSKDTVGQSGVSKRMDTEDGNCLLSQIAKTLEKIEPQIADMYLLVAGDGQTPARKIAVEVVYPKDFDLFGPDELAGLIAEYQAALQGCGATPDVDAEMLKRLLRLILKGCSDEEFKVFEADIDRFVETKAALAGMQAEFQQANTSAAIQQVGENVPGTQSGPDSINAAQLASSGVLVTEVY